MNSSSQPTPSVSTGFSGVQELTVRELKIMLSGMPADALVCDAKGGTFILRDTHNGSFLMEAESSSVHQRCLLPVL